MDDHLLPDRSAEPVTEVVHLVHDDVAEAGDCRAPDVEHVAQDLGGHHDDRSPGVDGVVAGEQADRLGTVPLDEVVELLIRQCLDRCRVKALLAGRQRKVNREFADDGLAGPGGRADENPVAVLQSQAGLALERIEIERVFAAEGVEYRVAGPLPGGGVPVGRRGHAVQPKRPVGETGRCDRFLR